jgi:hypothetical protein
MGKEMIVKGTGNESAVGKGRGLENMEQGGERGGLGFTGAHISRKVKRMNRVVCIF